MAAMMRQRCKQILTMVLCAALLQAAPLAARADALVTSIVIDPLTGVAMDGYDPVSYFTEAQPQRGNPDYVYSWAGVPWYFASAANRDVFMRNPDVYAPQYGGHCQMSLARGFLSDGKPEVYAIEGMKLYLFYSAANREAFLLSPGEAQQRAAAHWAQLAPEYLNEDARVWLAAAPASSTAVAQADAHAESHGDTHVEAAH